MFLKEYDLYILITLNDTVMPSFVRDYFSGFSRNSEADASEFPENHEITFPLYFMQIDA